MKKLLKRVITLGVTCALAFCAVAFVPMTTMTAEAVTYGKMSESDKTLIRGLFDATYYASTYPDVKNAYGTNADKLYDHFTNFGIYEGRQCSEDFNVNAYASAYSDLRKAFGYDIVAYYRHYQKYGKSEKRNITTIPLASSNGISVVSLVTGSVISNSSNSNASSKKSSAVSKELLYTYYYYGLVNVGTNTQEAGGSLVYKNANAMLKGKVYVKGAMTSMTTVTIILYDTNDNIIGYVPTTKANASEFNVNSQPAVFGNCTGNAYACANYAMISLSDGTNTYYALTPVTVQ